MQDNVKSLPIGYYEKLRRDDVSPDIAFSSMKEKFPTFLDIPAEISLIWEWRNILAHMYECFVDDVPFCPTSIGSVELCANMVGRNYLKPVAAGYSLTRSGRAFTQGAWLRKIELVVQTEKPKQTIGRWLFMGLLGWIGFALSG